MKLRLLCSLLLSLLVSPSLFAQGDIVEEFKRETIQGKMLFEGGKYDEAIPHAERALALAEKIIGPTHPALSGPLNDLATLYEKKGQYRKAEPLYLRALELLDHTADADQALLAITLNNLAVLNVYMGAYGQAEEHYQRALSLTIKAFGREHMNVGISLDNLAILYKDKGDLAKAEDYCLRGLAILKKSGAAAAADAAAATRNLGDIYYEMGDFRRAQPLLEQALTSAEKELGDGDSSLGIYLNDLAALHDDKHEYALAEPLYKKALAIYEQSVGPEHPEFAKSLDNLALHYVEMGDFQQAVPLFRRSLRIYKKVLPADHPDLARALNNLATVSQFTRDYPAAESLFLQALHIWEKGLGPDHEDVSNCLSNLALVEWAKGDRQQTLQFLSRNNQIREHNLGRLLSIGSEEQKRAFMAKLLADTDSTISLSLDMPSEPAALRLGLLTVLQRKGRLLESMVDEIGNLRARMNSDDAKLLDQLTQARARDASLMLAGPGDRDVAEYRSEIAQLQEAEDRLERAISSRSSEFHATTQPITIEAVQEVLRNKSAALVEFIRFRLLTPTPADPTQQWGSERYGAYVLAGEGQPKWVDLGDAAQVDALARRARQAASNPRHDEIKEVGRELDERVMRPVRVLLGQARNVFLSPDSQLNLVPFAALLDENGKYLVENYTLNYLTSGRDLLWLQVAVASRQPPLLLADPAYHIAVSSDTTSASRTVAPASSFPLRFVPLPGTAAEGDQIRDILHLDAGRLLTGPNATKAALRQAAGPRILHVATHGFFLADLEPAQPTAALSLKVEHLVRTPAAPNPLLRSGLALAGANRSQSDGLLTALEATSLDLWGTQLVVLSACDSGVGDVSNGEGVYGLRRALVMAGSRAQVMTLWKIDDDATQGFMASYYGRLAKGEGRAAALQAVQRDTLKSDEHRHPYYWASFINSGDSGPLDR